MPGLLDIRDDQYECHPGGEVNYREFAAAAWQVRDEDQRIMFSAGTWTGWLNRGDDTFAAAGPLDRAVPRTGALAAIAFEASERLRLEWKTTPTHASAVHDGKVVVIVDRQDNYRMRVVGDWWPPLLHLAAMHGVTLLRQEQQPKPRRRRGK